MIRELKVCDYVIVLMITIVSFVTVYLFSTIGFDPLHTGLMFQMAHDVANGKKMFVEVFNQYGVLPVYFQAVAIKLFGDSVHSIILSAVSAYVVSFCLNYLCFYRVVGRSIAVVSTLVLLLIGPYFIWTFLPWSSVYALMFTMLTLFFVEEYYTKRANCFWYLSAVSVFFVFLSRQPVGIVMILSFGVLFFSFRIIGFNSIKAKEWIYWMLVLLGQFIIYFALLFFTVGARGVEEYCNQMIIWPMKWSEDVGGLRTLFHHLFPFYDSNLIFSYTWIILPIACVILYIMIMYFIKKTKTKKGVIVLSFSIFGVASWAQYYPVTCIRHVYWSAFPMVGLFCWGCLWIVKVVLKCLKKARNKKGKDYKKLATAITLVIVLFVFSGDISMRVSEGANKWRSNTSVLKCDKGFGYLNGLRMSDAERECWTNLHSNVRELQKDYNDVLNLTNDAYYSLFSDSDYEPRFVFSTYKNVIKDTYLENMNNYIEINHPIILKYEYGYTEDTEWMRRYKLYTRLDILEEDGRPGGLGKLEIYVYNE